MKISTAVAAAVLVSIAGGGVHAEKRATAKLPKGLSMELILKDTIESRTCREGQPIYASLANPISAGGRTVVPSGTMLAGRVTKVSKPKAGLMKASIVFMFSEIKTSHGIVPISATVHLDLGALTAKGGKMAGTAVAKEAAKRAIPVLGTIFLIQDVANAAKFVTEDKEVVIPAGTHIKTTLDKDASVPL